MKRILFYFTICLLPVSGFSQINWVYDMTTAQALSLNQNKLIVLDFTATWCKPCKTMDERLWSSEEMKEIAGQYIFFKVDIDNNTAMASRFSIKSIPHVIVTNIAGDDLWSITGYSRSNKVYIDAFKQVPSDISLLNQKLLPFLKNKTTLEETFELGKAYQDLAKDQIKGQLKMSFLSLSNDCFKKLIKKKAIQAKEAELRLLLNLVYRGKTDKALGKIEKFPNDYFTEELMALKDSIRDLCQNKALK